MPIANAETRKTPPEFQDRITRAFGINRFGTPNFKIVWNQSEFIRTGDKWVRNGREYVGYRDIYKGSGQPCWVIMKWYPPEHYGSPDVYYDKTYDPVTKLYFVAEFPWEGRYEIIQPLVSKEIINGKLVIEHFPLSHYLIDVLMPMMEAHQKLSFAERRAAEQFAKEMEEKKKLEELTDRMHENMPTFLEPVSYSRQGCRTSLIDRKCYAIQQQWERIARHGIPKFTKGIQQVQGNSPV